MKGVAPDTLIFAVDQSPVLLAHGSNFSAPPTKICKAVARPVATALRAFRDGGATRFLGISKNCGKFVVDALGEEWIMENRVDSGSLKR